MSFVCMLVAGHVMFGIPSKLINLDEIVTIERIPFGGTQIETEGRAYITLADYEPEEVLNGLNDCYKEHNVE